jgi:hypothetical protein
MTHISIVEQYNNNNNSYSIYFRDGENDRFFSNFTLICQELVEFFTGNDE